MSTLFISDLHLDPERPATTEAFLAFLADEAADAERLYILGDLFEYWVGDDHATPLAEAVARGLGERHAAGTDLYFMAGNRDFLLGPAYAERCGMRILGDPAVILLDGKPLALTHGDLLCTDDTDYQAFRRRCRTREWIDAFLAKPLDERLAFAADAREQSRQHTENARPEIMDVNPRAVRHLAERLGVDTLLHGHTHRPAVHENPAEGCRRIVLGDWYDQGSIFVCREGRQELRAVGQIATSA